MPHRANCCSYASPAHCCHCPPPGPTAAERGAHPGQPGHRGAVVTVPAAARPAHARNRPVRHRPAVHPHPRRAHHGAGRRSGCRERGATPHPAARADGPDPRLRPGEPGRPGADSGRDRRRSPHLPALPAPTVPAGRTHRRRLVRERRLEQCRRDLADPHLAARPIHAITAQWGFTSPAHSSQAFRSAYGLSPRQFRLAVHAEAGVVST
ncbi:helix-turn-helix domain-containing protein [Streptomyces muensis]|uniref:helix-turn-helix domain-containing protein n=1 Tax=Streptomyces muensis TaxID=1077944 RepID=UPI0035592D75